MNDQRDDLNRARAKRHLSDGHNHTLPLDPATKKPHTYANRADELAARRANCPACRLHDHDDMRTFAFTRDNEPLPAYYFTCPGCDTASARTLAHGWTPAGIAWLRREEAV